MFPYLPIEISAKTSSQLQSDESRVDISKEEGKFGLQAVSLYNPQRSTKYDTKRATSVQKVAPKSFLRLSREVSKIIAPLSFFRMEMLITENKMITKSIYLPMSNSQRASTAVIPRASYEAYDLHTTQMAEFRESNFGQITFPYRKCSVRDMKIIAMTCRMQQLVNGSLTIARLEIKLKTPQMPHCILLTAFADISQVFLKISGGFQKFSSFMMDVNGNMLFPNANRSLCHRPNATESVQDRISECAHLEESHKEAREIINEDGEEDEDEELSSESSTSLSLDEDVPMLSSETVDDLLNFLEQINEFKQKSILTEVIVSPSGDTWDNQPPSSQLDIPMIPLRAVVELNKLHKYMTDLKDDSESTATSTLDDLSEQSDVISEQSDVISETDDDIDELTDEESEQSDSEVSSDESTTESTHEVPKINNNEPSAADVGFSFMPSLNEIWGSSRPSSPKTQQKAAASPNSPIMPPKAASQLQVMYKLMKDAREDYTKKQKAEPTSQDTTVPGLVDY